MKLLATVILWLAALVVASPPAPARAGQDQPRPPGNGKVLVLYSYNSHFPLQREVSEGFEATLRGAGFPSGNILHEYLDIAPPRSPGQVANLRRLLLEKYAGQQFGLIAAVLGPAYEFVSQEGAMLSPGTPCLSLTSLPNPAKPGRPVIPIQVNYDVRGTLELALRLFPETKRVLFVAGSGKFGRRGGKAGAARPGALPGPASNRLPGGALRGGAAA